MRTEVMLGQYLDMLEEHSWRGRPEAELLSRAHQTLAFERVSRGDFVRARSAVLAADVSPKEAAQLDAAVGSPVWFSFAATAATLYPTVHSDRTTSS